MPGVLFVHNNFPGQFLRLATHLVSKGVPCGMIGAEAAPGLDGLATVRYRLPRGSTPNIYPLAVRAEADLIRGHQAMKAAKVLRDRLGFNPDVIVGHPGWGETMLLDEIYPRARQVMFHEFFYRGRGLDVGFDSEFFEDEEQAAIVAEAKNLGMCFALSKADEIVSPTPFQASTLPKRLRNGVRIIHEGIDTNTICPAPAQPFRVNDTLTLQPGQPVITYVNRQLEPLRGMHIFARALPRLLEQVPDAQVLIIGDPVTQAYSGTAPEGQNWKDACLSGVEEKLDPARVHFLGSVEPARLLEAMRISTAHVYYSYPFVLSWSLVEAMAAGCYIIGSDTAPVRDAIENGLTGTLLPFFDVDALSEAMIKACRNPDAQAGMRAAARRKAVAQFDSARANTRWCELLSGLGVAIPD